MIDIWHTHNLIGLVASVLLLWRPWRLNAINLALCYFTISGLLVFCNPYSPWVFGYTARTSLIPWVAGMATVTFIIVTQAITVVGKRTMAAVLGLIAANCLAVIALGRGIFHAHSFDAAMGVVVLPLALERLNDGRYKAAVIALVVSAVVISGGTTGYVALAALVASWFVLRARWLYVVGSVAAILGFASALVGFELLNSWGRYQAWSRSILWWWENARILIGTGLGTFEILGPMIEGKTKGVFVFMHNDYLQVLFETGIIGFGLAGYIWVRSWYNARVNPYLFAAFSAASVVLFTQFPLRFFLSSLLLGLMVKEGWFSENPNRTKSKPSRFRWMQEYLVGKAHRGSHMENRRSTD